MYHGEHMGFFPMGYGFFGWIIIIAIIGVIIYFLLKNSNNLSNNERKNSSTALDILEKRFANDEISKEEFLEKRKILKEGG